MVKANKSNDDDEQEGDPKGDLKAEAKQENRRERVKLSNLLDQYLEDVTMPPPDELEEAFLSAFRKSPHLTALMQRVKDKFPDTAGHSDDAGASLHAVDDC